MKLRIATFNVENLFGRTKVFNFEDHTIGDEILRKIDDLRNLLRKVLCLGEMRFC